MTLCGNRCPLMASRETYTSLPRQVPSLGRTTDATRGGILVCLTNVRCIGRRCELGGSASYVSPTGTDQCRKNSLSGAGEGIHAAGQSVKGAPGGPVLLMRLASPIAPKKDTVLRSQEARSRVPRGRGIRYVYRESTAQHRGSSKDCRGGSSQSPAQAHSQDTSQGRVHPSQAPCSTWVRTNGGRTKALNRDRVA
jgi:hypothetical protein